jgi:hypothetical protein
MTTDPMAATDPDVPATVDTDRDDVVAEAAEPAAEGTAPDDPTAPLRREAAGYRRQLRAVEGERDNLATRLSALQRREAERVAAEGTGTGNGFRVLADPCDLWREVELSAVLDEAGDVAPAKVAEAVRAVLAAHPHWARPMPSFNGGPRTSVESGPTFRDVLRGR